MASYKVEFTRSATKEIERILLIDRRRILERVSDLSLEPRPSGAIRLKNSEAYRLRQGDYRILYTIDDDRVIVTVVRVGHRQDVYR